MKLDEILECIGTNVLTEATTQKKPKKTKLTPEDKKAIADDYISRDENRVSLSGKSFPLYTYNGHPKFKAYATNPTVHEHGPIDVVKVAKALSGKSGGKNGKVASGVGHFGGFLNTVLSRVMMKKLTNGIATGDIYPRVSKTIESFLKTQISELVDTGMGQIAMPFDWNGLEDSIAKTLTKDDVVKEIASRNNGVPSLLPTSKIIEIGNDGKVEVLDSTLGRFLANMFVDALKSSVKMLPAKEKALQTQVDKGKINVDVLLNQIDYMGAVNQFVSRVYSSYAHDGEESVEGFNIPTFVSNELGKSPDSLSQQEIANIDRALANEQVPRPEIEKALSRAKDRSSAHSINVDYDTLETAYDNIAR